MKRMILIILLFLSCSYDAFSQQVTKQEAINAAINTMRYNGMSNISKSNIANVYTKQNGDTTLLYEVIFKSGEMVLLSGNKTCLPILGYNIPEKKVYTLSILDNYDDIPDGLKDMLEEYIDQILYCFRNSISRGYLNEWNELQSFQANRAIRSIIVEPLLTSMWGQGISNDNSDCYSYNYYVTETNNICTCNVQYKCPTGCVAVAMSQIMNYWKYPVWRSDKTYQYDWCNMPDSLLTYRSNYIQERNAIARLMKDCGESVNMIYCINNECASGAYSSNVPNALKDFGYNNANLKQKFWHQINWTTLLQSDLDNGWPIYYSGSGNAGGHAFVCDGYDNNNLFHFNWGWNGEYNMWCTVSQLNPYNFYFTSDQEAVFNIYPSSTQDYCDFELPLWVHYYEYYNISSNTTPLPYQNVPKTFTRLVSVPDTLNFPSSWRTIPVGAAAEYVAHEEIVLQNGFLAEEGSDFHAHIVPCPSCSGNSVQSMDVENTLSPMNDTYMPSQQDSSGTFLSESQVEQRLQVWPNPVSGTLHIQLPDAEKEVVGISVCDLLGRVMLQKENFSTKTDLDVSMLSRGMYIIQVRTLEGNNMTAKFVKE